MSLEWQFVEPLPQGALEEVEKIIGKTLPIDYKALVEKYNEGYPSLKVFDTTSSNEHVFNSLLSLNKNDKYGESVFHALNGNFEDKKLLPFGSDPFGNFICYEVETMKVVYWLHETSEVEFVADNVTEFLLKLY